MPRSKLIMQSWQTKTQITGVKYIRGKINKSTYEKIQAAKYEANYSNLKAQTAIKSALDSNQKVESMKYFANEAFRRARNTEQEKLKAGEELNKAN